MAPTCKSIVCILFLAFIAYQAVSILSLRSPSVLSAGVVTPTSTSSQSHPSHSRLETEKATEATTEVRDAKETEKATEATEATEVRETKEAKEAKEANKSATTSGLKAEEVGPMGEAEETESEGLGLGLGLHGTRYPYESEAWRSAEEVARYAEPEKTHKVPEDGWDARLPVGLDHCTGASAGKEGGGGADKFVFVTAVSGMERALRNFLAHLNAVNVPLKLAALDNETLALAYAHVDAAVDFDAYRLDLNVDSSGNERNSGFEFKRVFAIAWIGEALRWLCAGHDVFLTDIDVVWVEDPRPFLYCSGPECGSGGLDRADMAWSSDNLGVVADVSLGGAYANHGQYNTGMVFIRATHAGIEATRQWLAAALDGLAGDGPFAEVRTHQEAFNRLMIPLPNENLIQLPYKNNPTRISNKALDARTGGDRSLPAVKPVVGLLPLSAFCSGHVAFVQGMAFSRRSILNLNYPAFALHATYTRSNSAFGKEYRFREAHLWWVADETEPTPERIGEVTYTPLARLPPKFAPNVADAEAHLRATQLQLRDFRVAAALAVVLNRTLVLPRFTCHCDAASMDNLMSVGCQYPGSQVPGDLPAELTKYVPYPCPLDHIIDTTRVLEEENRVNGVHIVPYSADPDAPHLLLPSKGLPSLLAGSHLPTISDFSDAANKALVSLGPGASTSVIDVTPWITAYDGRSPVALKHMRSDETWVERAFRQISILAHSNNWCSECYPEPCTKWINKTFIETNGGVVSPTRGDQEFVCFDLLADDQ